MCPFMENSLKTSNVRTRLWMVNLLTIQRRIQQRSICTVFQKPKKESINKHIMTNLKTHSYRGGFSLMALLPWRSESGVRGFLLVTPDREQTGWQHVKDKYTHTYTKDKTTKQKYIPRKKHTPDTSVIAVSVKCLYIRNIMYCRWFNITKICDVNSQLAWLVSIYGRWRVKFCLDCSSAL